MTTNQTPNLLATSVTSLLKKSGLHCEAGSFRSGGFAARQISKYRNGYKIGVERIEVSFYAGWSMTTPAEAVIKAKDALIAKGYSVKVNVPNGLARNHSLTITLEDK